MRSAVDPQQLLERLRPLLAAPEPDSLSTFETAYQSIRDTPAEGASEALVECLLLIAHFYYLSSKAASALQPASEAAAYARSLGDKRLLRKALTFVGVMQMETGNLPGAMEAYAEALQLARGLEDPELEAPVWNNIGTALMNGAQYADAIKCLERAIAVARGSQKHMEPIALSNMSYCALQLRDIRTGLKSVRKAIELNPDPATAKECLDRTIAECNYARLLLEVGEVVHAQEHCDSAREFASRMPGAKAEYTALQTSGLIDVFAGRIDIGLARLSGALQHAREYMASDVADALSMCIDGYQAAGQPDVALEYLRELSELTKAQQHEQLRQQLQRVGVVPVEDDADQRLQLKAWDLADQVRRKEEVLVESAVRAALASGYDARRPFRVAKLVELFASHEGSESRTIAQWKMAALLANIGMVAIPARLIARKGPLAGDERALVHEHVRYGAQLVEEAGLAKHRPCIELIRSHRERWDGTGPFQLRAADIPLGAQVVALCDAYDALTHDRPWRRAKTVQEAVFEIEEADGQFDPDLTKRFAAFIRQEFWAHRNFEAFLGEEATTSSFVGAHEQIARMLSQDMNRE